MVNDTIRLSRTDLRHYRGPLLDIDERAPAVVYARGNLHLLRPRLVAFFCSIRRPEVVAEQAIETCQNFAHHGISIIGPFHSALEQNCLNVLLQGTAPIIICPGRAVEEMRLRPLWKQAFAEGRLLLLSHFAPKVKRVTTETARTRNRFVAAMADEVFAAYADPGGKIEALCHDVLTWHKPVYTVDNESNRTLIHAGARPLRPSTAAQQLAMFRLGG